MKQAAKVNRRSRRLTYGFRAITLLIILLICEGALRLLTPPTFLQGTYPNWPWLIMDPVVGWKNRAGFPPPEINPTPYRINSLGFRGPEFTKAKPGGASRIVCLGDSGTFGIRRTTLSEESETVVMRMDNDYPRKLAQLLQVEGPANVEVINAGVIGYTSSHGLRLLNTEILDLHPDIITIRFGFNDHLLAWNRSLVPEEPANSVIRGLYYNFLHWRMTRIFLRIYKDAWSRHPEWNEGPWVSVERFKANLHRFAEVGRKEGFHVLLLDYPLRPLSWGKIPSEHIVIKRSGQKDQRELYQLHKRYQQAIRKVAREERIPLLETAEQLHGPDPHAYGDLDFTHPNNYGSREIARLLREKLIELNWISGVGSGLRGRGRPGSSSLWVAGISPGP